MAGDAIWLEVLPALGAFASDLVKGTTKASKDAGATSGAAFGKALTEGATSSQSGLVASLEKSSKAAQAAVDRETQAIAKARASQRDAAAKVIEAEAKLEQARASGDGAKVAAAEERLAGARERAAGAAAGVEMRRDLIEQQYGWRTAQFGHQRSMGEDQRKQQRLLFAGRTTRRRLAIAIMAHKQVVAVRA